MFGPCPLFFEDSGIPGSDVGCFGCETTAAGLSHAHVTLHPAQVNIIGALERDPLLHLLLDHLEVGLIFRSDDGEGDT